MNDNMNNSIEKITKGVKKKIRLLRDKIPIECDLPTFTKTPLHLEGQYYPSKELNINHDIFQDYLKKIDNIVDPQKKDVQLHEIKNNNDVHLVGIELSISELRSLRAIQKLFTLTDYKGNMPEKRIFYDGNNDFNFIGYITPLKIRISDYLTAYQVNKNIDKNGRARFNAHEREEALKALSNLSSKVFFFYFTKKQWVKSPLGTRKEKVDVIQTIAPLFTYSHYIPEELVHHSTKSSRIDYMIIKPTPIMLLGINNYFMLIPSYEQEIRQASLGKRIPKEVYTFLGYLIYQAEILRGKRYRDWLTVQVRWETLLYKLRLDHYFSKRLRNPKKAYTIIECCIEYACKTKYLLSYVIEEKQGDKTYIFNLNQEKFYQYTSTDERTQ